MLAVQADLALEAIRQSGCLRFRAVGSSMLPSVWPGDVLVVHGRGIQDVKPGEIAFFSCYGGVVAHRVKARSQECLTTQGDTIPAPDPPVTAENLLGVVISIERNGKIFAPPLRPGLLARCTAAILRRSDFAMRVWLHVHSLRSQANLQLKIVSSSLTESS